VEGSNLDLINEWIEDFGIDSDFVKVRVLGMFPSASDNQFISTDIIDACANMPDPALSLLDPLIVSVDVARSGSDLTVIRFRKGRDARSMKPIIWRGATDTMDIASKIAEIARGSIHTLNEKPDAIFIDGGGVGGGVVDRCKQLGVEVIEVNGQSSASNPYCANMRASMWWNAREAMGNGIAIDPKDLALREQLGSQEFGYQKSTDKILLITKEQMKKMGIASPDHADAFVQSFSYTVHREAPRALDGQSHALNANMVDHGDGQVSH
ncbi:MAG: hypothetical protein JKY93_12790, partial [Gammaproteobacteria bacterium]|nr:hypothetical protein [Gammaproteobacteria bacterium]